MVAHPADFQDAEGAELVLVGLRATFRRLATLWADRAYEAAREWIEAELGLALEIVAKAADQRGFVVLPKRWIVERTLAWLLGFRRLGVRYERRADILHGLLHLACALICVRLLSPPETG